MAATGRGYGRHRDVNLMMSGGAGAADPYEGDVGVGGEHAVHQHRQSAPTTTTEGEADLSVALPALFGAAA